MPWNRSKPEHGHDILGELHQHVEDFHSGLGRLEERLVGRRDAVEARLHALEGEHADLEGGLEHIAALRKGDQR